MPRCAKICQVGLKRTSSLPSEHLAGKGVWGLEAPTAGWKPAPLTSPVHGPNGCHFWRQDFP